jgi:hypothetical protein
VYSELAREAPLTLTILKFFLARSTEAGSRTLVHAGLSGVESHGKYLSDCQVEEPAAIVTSEEGQRLQRKVWEELEEILEGIKSGVTKNVRDL